jgi:RNA polymerase sigma-70 factor
MRKNGGEKDEPPHLVVTFLEHSGGRIAVPGGTEFEATLYRAWEDARAPWPKMDLSADVFVRHVAIRMSETHQGASLESLLKRLALDELYLACACVHRIPSAVKVLEQRYLAHLPTLLAHLRFANSLIDDVGQMVRIHLLMGSEESGPQLDRFAGRGSLLGWIRIVAERIALRLGASIRETVDGDIDKIVENLPATESDAEKGLLTRRFSREFRMALREGFAALSSEQRDLIRLYFIEELSTTELGLRLGLNQSTVSRRLKAARRAIYEEAKGRVQERLGLSSSGFESHLKAMGSQVDVSLGTLM